MKDYNYKQDLQKPTETWHTIILPNSVFGKAKSNLADLRIYGITAESDTIEAPYILKVNSKKVENKSIPFKIFNQSKTDEGFYYTFQTDGEDLINQIKLKFGIENFDWRVKLEGSQNQNEWFNILDDYRILSIKTVNTDYSFTTLSFNSAKYRYYRLFINSAKKPKLIRASISKNQILEGVYDNHTIAKSSNQINKKNKTSVLDISLDARLPISSMEISVANDFDYYRPFKLEYISDSLKTEKGVKYTYRTLARGTLNSIEKNNFNFETVLSKALRLTIYNTDNQPLNIQSVKVKGYKHQLVSRFTEDANYSLVYGNSKARLPRYDIKTFENNIPKQLSNLTLGNIKVIKKSDTENSSSLFESKYWLWAIMLIVILILGGFTLKMISKK
ncbi:DUF3999 family protein [Winogradskyella litorisediminis]|uniref:DUF3999 family protein n=1 Tax=Winogradskyella litorisediminis TaxID=1156618 RepID=A0ABW3N5A4_9FLAO